MEAVLGQLEDVPHDSKAPLFPFGAGLTYTGRTQRNIAPVAAKLPGGPPGIHVPRSDR